MNCSDDAKVIKMNNVHTRTFNTRTHMSRVLLLHIDNFNVLSAVETHVRTLTVRCCVTVFGQLQILYAHYKTIILTQYKMQRALLHLH